MFAGWAVILAGGTLGHLLGETPYSREAVVLLCALLAGWASGSHPGVAAVTRFFAVAAAAAPACASPTRTCSRAWGWRG